MATGWRRIDGQWYLLGSSGAMLTGWQHADGCWYWMDRASGAMVVGWLLCPADGQWYWLGPSGAMSTGWVWTGGHWYLLGSSGAMLTGWQSVGGHWYWLDASGAMAVGWRWLDGKWNAFDQVSGVWLTDDPVLVDGWYTAQRVSSRTNWCILVDYEACRVLIYHWNVDQWMPLYNMPCSPGAYGSPTVHGRFAIGSRGYSFGHGYTCYYWTQFYGNYLFHSVLYYPGGGIKDGRMGQHISHGCVRMYIWDARWIYDTIPSGTMVYVY